MECNIKIALSISLFVSLCGIVNCDDDSVFPKDFLIGVASSAYQIEGAWNANGKGESVWDYLLHNNLWPVADKTNGDVAADFFHKYKEDVAILKDVGFQFYRFSISWTRILPNGIANEINKDGIKYYSDLIDEVREKGLEPFVTIYHYDHPQVFEKLGGWQNELMVEWIADYARIIFRELGPKVKYFTTINQANILCQYMHVVNRPLYQQYICTHNVLKAHAKLYHIYDEEFRPTQEGQIGISIMSDFYSNGNATDTLTSEIAFQYDPGWVAHPIFSEEGDYPVIMRDRIDENSRIQGWPRSKLPQFTKEEIEYIKGTSDYFGLNHYSSTIAVAVKKQDSGWLNDKGFVTKNDPNWPNNMFPPGMMMPQGLSGILRKIKEEYGNPPVYVLENGYADKGSIKDYNRIKYLYSYLKEMLQAMKEGCDVKGYSAWTFLDAFEWTEGYTIRFGIVHVDMQSPNKTRTYKASAYWFRDVLRTRKLIPVDDYIE